jgi:glutamate-1-semialdehyde 2,1-aminomutase
MTIEGTYIERNPRSAELYRRAQQSLPSGVTHDARFQRPFPIYVERAAGAHKWDADGHDLVDYVMGHGALLLGHAHPVVTEAAARQVALGSHYGAGHEHEIRWAEAVIRSVPSAEVVRFTSSGTEATLMALRLARAASGRPAILKFDRHFHGWHDYVIASSHYGARAPSGVPDTTLDSVVVVAPEMHVVRETVASRPDIGAIIVEASGASMGTIPLPRGFLAELADYCRDRDIVLVMDEVVTGFRWSTGGVQQREGVTPDLTALAKILAGGFPGGAVTGRRDIMERLSFPDPGKRTDKVGHPGTFNANPVSAAAGAACLEHIADGEHQARAERTAHAIQAQINAAFRDASVPGFAYGQSSGIKFVIGGDTLPEPRAYHPLEPPQDLLLAGSKPQAQRLMNLAMANHGVHIFGNGLIVSAVHEQDDIDRTAEAWRASLRELQDEGAV